MKNINLSLNLQLNYYSTFTYICINVLIDLLYLIFYFTYLPNIFFYKCTFFFSIFPIDLFFHSFFYNYICRHIFEYFPFWGVEGVAFQFKWVWCPSACVTGLVTPPHDPLWLIAPHLHKSFKQKSRSKKVWRNKEENVKTNRNLKMNKNHILTLEYKYENRENKPQKYISAPFSNYRILTCFF